MVCRAEASAATRRPVTNSLRWKQWVPRSPTMKEAPDCAGSVRQAACLLSPSLGPDSQPSANSTCTMRTAPSSPASISARASRTIG
jgi:hypothetical protein